MVQVHIMLFLQFFIHFLNHLILALVTICNILQLLDDDLLVLGFFIIFAVWLTADTPLSFGRPHRMIRLMMVRSPLSWFSPLFGYQTFFLGYFAHHLHYFIDNLRLPCLNKSQCWCIMPWVSLGINTAVSCRVRLTLLVLPAISWIWLLMESNV